VVNEHGGVWQTAIEVPGTAALNSGAVSEYVDQDSGAAVNSLSCASPGNCSAAGYYTDGSSHSQAFVVNEHSGVWETAVEVPGTAALNSGENAATNSISCARAGSCSAAGYYTDGAGRSRAFVVDELGGGWHTAVEVTGVGYLSSISCASPGNCSAGGYLFVVNERDGHWASAIEVPGTAGHDAGGGAVSSLSCASAGNCSAGGFYSEGDGESQAFVVNQHGGVWQTAVEVPATVTPKAIASGNTGVSLSCALAGSCSAVGSYTAASGYSPGFAESEAAGAWGSAVVIRGTASLYADGSAQVISLACPAAGNCSAGGFYTDRSGRQAFVVNERRGVWLTAREVRGTAMLNADGNAEVSSLSCASSGNCSAGGFYTNSSGQQAFVASERSGVWQTAREVPGTAALNSGEDAAINSISCARAGSCSGAGYYTDGSGHSQALIADEDGGIWQTSIEVPRIGRLSSISCASPGNCSAGGSHFVVNEQSGHWQTAIDVHDSVTVVACPSRGNCSAAGTSETCAYPTAGFGAFFLNETHGVWGAPMFGWCGSGTGCSDDECFMAVDSLSCPSSGNCSAGGSMLAGDDGLVAFVFNERRGKGQSSVVVNGALAINSLSCPTAGNCFAGGYNVDGSGDSQAFVAKERDGVWQTAVEVPGMAALDTGGGATVNSLSCARAGGCSAGGYYTDDSGYTQAYVVNQG
jgi:hypothetical protein